MRAAAAGDSPARVALARRTRLALYAAVAALLFLVERFLPNPVPWVRLGLANVVTLVVLVEHGAADAAAVLALRLVLGGFFGGTLFGPQFALAVAGGAASWAAMALGARFGGRVWSAVGLSLLGATAHALAQLGAASLLFAGRDAFAALLPLFLGLAAGTGLVTGLAAETVLRRLWLARAPGTAAGP